MSHPSMVLIKSIRCLKTDDFTGQDDLVAVLGADSFVLGSFKEETDVLVELSLPIAAGVTEMIITEQDFTGDDILGTIDLLVDMDVERIVAIFGDRARYDIVLTVISEPD